MNTNEKNPHLAFALDYLEVVNYALVQSKMDICKWCIVENKSDEDLTDLHLEFSGEYIEPFTTPTYQVGAGQRVRIQDISLQVNLPKLLALTERIQSTILLQLMVGNECVREQAFPIAFMAYNQWHGTDCFPQLLASFITPNHPCIPPIIKRASQHLLTLTGSSEFNNYYCGTPEGVISQTKAIYQALQEEGFSYSIGTPSYEESGQRIRLANEVIETKMGNCMDFTLLFAACLEYVGINPLLVMEKGHIYIGAWIVADSHARSVDDDVSFLLKKCSEGVDEVILLETTDIANTEKPTFEMSIRNALEHLVIEENFQLFFDVYRCRLEGFRPLPQLVQREGEYILSDNAPLPYSPQESPIVRYEEREAELRQKATRQQLWERKLLDFTLRNPLLSVRTSSVMQFMSVDVKEVAQRMLESSKGFRIDECPAGMDVLPNGQVLFDSMQLNLDMVNLVRDDLKNARLHSYYPEKETLTILKRLRRTAKVMIEENGANSLFISFGLLKWTEDLGTGAEHLAPILLMPADFTYRNQVYHVKWRGEETMLNVTLFEYLKQTFELEFDGLEEALNAEGGPDVQRIFAIIRNGLLKKPHWNVQEECLLGIFSFSKFVMWNDIHTHGTRMALHPIIHSLMENDAVTPSSDEPTDAALLDETLKPSDLCLPLPVDSSQLCAIVEASQGKSFILHGPPGTGKSQTIANMITNALYHGKRVLFVAEKMAALSVVQSRLEKLGLAPFCLELHSNKATKTHLINQLNAVFKHIRKKRTGENLHEEASSKLWSQRSELKAYVDALHGRKSADDFSLYECITHYSRFKEECHEPIPFISEERPAITPQTLNDHEYYITRLEAILKLVGTPASHPLLGLKPVGQCMAHLPELKQAMDTCIRQSKALETSVAQLAEMLHTVPCISSQSISKQMEQALTLHQLRSELLATSHPRILESDAQALDFRWREICASNFLVRFFKKRNFLKEMRIYCTSLTADTLPAYLEKLLALDAHPLHHQIDRHANLDSIADSYSAWKSTLSTLHQWIEMTDADTLSLSELATRMTTWSHHLDKLKDWKQWCLLKEDLIQKGMCDIPFHIEHSAISIPELKSGYLASYFYEQATRMIASNPVTDIFNGLLFDEKVAHYKELAQQFQELSREELVLSLRLRAGKAIDNPSLQEQVVALNRTLYTNGRGVTIRQLFEQIPDIISQFCPCMLMSPMSVAQYLDIEGCQPFDLVIFDEASQIPTCEAVGAMSRGKAVVIVGDTRQMPPTTFFTNTKVAEGEFDVDDMESILEDCHALKMPSLLLSCHYRSKHESLICFSNNEFYENKLNTFPSADDRERRVVYVPVKGIYQKGRKRSNRDEAQAVVNEIERRLTDEHLRQFSMGVICFNVNQQYLIEDLLEARMEKNRALKEWAEESGEPIFIKNLENVQGDERDVILFSIGYGPDKEGKVSMNFGPLNLGGGERRLNVAITRSRYEMMVFSSLHARDIDLRRTHAKGVEGLRRFLEYAETGTLVQNASLAEKESVEKVVTQQIADQLALRGVQAETFVGQSHLKVNIAILDPKDPQRYLLGILIDDKGYHRTPTMSDREIVHPTALNSLGWQVKRVWTLDWFERPQHVIDAILNSVLNFRK